MPARAIEDKRGVRAGGYGFADFLKMRFMASVLA